MAKMKGLFKGIKYISQIFVSKEHEMEIGNPTNVRHVAHIGYDSGASVSSPSWMKEFKTSSDFSSTSLENLEQSKQTSCPPQDFNPRVELQRPAEVLVAKAPKKVKRKKPKASSPSSTLRPSAKPSKTRASCAASLGVEDGIPEPILVN